MGRVLMYGIESSGTSWFEFCYKHYFDLLSLSSKLFFSRKLTVYTMPASLVKALVTRPN